MRKLSVGQLLRGGSIGAVIAVGALVPTLITTPVWEGIAVQVLIYACGALGLTMILGYAGQISLVQAGFMGIGAYAPAILAVKYGLSPWWGLPAGVAAAMLLAAIVGAPVLRLEGLYLALATLALNTIMVIVAQQLTEYTGGPFGLAGLQPLELFGWSLVEAEDLYYAVFVSFLFLLLCSYRLVRSPVGSMFAALRHDPRAAALAGIPVARLKIKTFVLSAAYAAVGGFFLAEYLLLASPESFGVVASLYLLLMVIVGGMRSLSGALIGAAYVIIVPQVIPEYPREQQFLFAISFLVIVVFVPEGLAGIAVRLWRKLRRSLSPDASSREPGKAEAGSR